MFDYDINYCSFAEHFLSFLRNLFTKANVLSKVIKINKQIQLSALLKTLALLTTYKCTICCYPAWSLLCLFRSPHMHRSAYSLCAIPVTGEYSSTR